MCITLGGKTSMIEDFISTIWTIGEPDSTAMLVKNFTLMKDF